MSDLTCPYCEHGNDVPDECEETNFIHETECNKCKKFFGFETSYYPSYSERELPCLNGKPHKWREYASIPESKYILFVCDYCDKKENKLRADILEAQS